MLKEILLLGASLTVGLATAAINVRENLGLDRILSVEADKWTEETHEFFISIDADIFGPQENSIHFRLSPEGIEKLTESGIPFTDATNEWLAHFDETLNDPNLFCSEGAENCAARGMNEFYDNYQDLDAIEARISNLVAAHDNAELKVIGQSFEGRDLKMVEIGNDGAKPIGLVFCTIHAREWLAPMFCTYLIETLLTQGHPLLDTYAFSIVAVANPDGFDYSTKVDNMWRKTRKPNAGSNCIGTDGNRNWDDNHCGVGSSTNPCSQTYCGTAPFDQSEVQALNLYSLANKNRIMAMLDIHSYGSYVIHPFGYTEVLPPAEDYVRMRQCAQKATTAAGAIDDTTWKYGTTPQVLGYSSGGTSKDYFYASVGTIYPYTVELRGNGFQPRPSNIKISNDEAFALFEGVFMCTTDIEIDGNLPDIDEFCIDEENPGVYFSDEKGALVSAQCPELEPFCDKYPLVAKNCQKTCGCFGRNQPDDGDNEPVVIDRFQSSTFPQVIVGLIGVSIIVALIIAAGKSSKNDEKTEGTVTAPTV